MLFRAEMNRYQWESHLSCLKACDKDINLSSEFKTSTVLSSVKSEHKLLTY